MNVRALDGTELARVRGIVERCARAAAMASDVALTVTVRNGYRDMVNNMALARRFGEHMRALGRPPRERDASVGAGSTDMGDVSHVVPSIHPYLAIVGEGLSVSGRTSDGLVEAIERGTDDGAWMLGVQWHPEETAAEDPSQQALFDTLVGLAGDRAVSARPA